MAAGGRRGLRGRCTKRLRIWMVGGLPTFEHVCGALLKKLCCCGVGNTRLGCPWLVGEKEPRAVFPWVSVASLTGPRKRLCTRYRAGRAQRVHSKRSCCRRHLLIIIRFRNEASLRMTRCGGSGYVVALKCCRLHYWDCRVDASARLLM